MKKRILAFMMAVFLVGFVSVRSYADAASLTIAGGAIATGGIGATAAAGGPITLVVLAAVGLGLTACGLNVELTEASQAAGMTKTQFILNKLEEWGNAGDRSLNEINDTIASGVKIGKDGTIVLSHQASAQIKQFGNWLFSSDKVSDPFSNAIDRVVINNITFPYARNFSMLSNKGKIMTFSLNTDVAIVNCGGNNLLLFNKSGHIVGNCILEGNINVTINSTNVRNGYTYYGWNTGIERNQTINNINLPYTDLSISSFLNSLDGTFDPSQAGINQDTFVGTQEDWDANSGALSPSAGSSTVIDPDLLDDITTSIANGTIGMMDYINALTRALDGVAGGIRVTDTDTGTVVDGTIAIDTAINPTIDFASDNNLDWQVNPPKPVIDDKDPDIDPDEAMPPLKIQLKGVFPFCLPFDAVDMIKKLSAEPTAPYYQVHWHVPIINQYLDFTIDLSGWNSVAAICRNMELLLFCIALAVATRSIFIRS